MESNGSVDYLKERIKFETEAFKQLATLFFLVGSGVTTLAVSFYSSKDFIIAKAIFMVLGCIGSGAVIGALRHTYKKIGELIDFLDS